MNRMRSLQVGPPFREFSFHDPPNDDATELNLLPGYLVHGTPCVSDDNFVAFGDDVFDRDVNIRKPPKRSREILLGASRAWW